MSFPPDVSAPTRPNPFRLKLPIYLILSLFIPLILYSGMRSIGLDAGDLLFNMDDLFADNIKSSIAFRSITGILAEEPDRMAAWPSIFREYYYNNPYIEPSELTRFHAPPLMAFWLMMAAKLIMLIGPNLAILIQSCLFFLLCLLAVRVMAAVRPTPVMMQIAAFVILALSYPALFMLQRANFYSGFSSVCIVIYALTAVGGRYRWLGYVCLAIAIGCRPNTAVVGFLEFVVNTGLRERLMAVAKVGLTAAAISLAAFVAANQMDPEYTLANFIRGLRIYNDLYAVRGLGLEYNFSLYGMVRVIRHFLDMTPYSAALAMMVTAMAVAVAAAMMWLALRNRLTPAEGIFLGVGYTIVFTPVIGLYHILGFAAPLLVLLSIAPDEREGNRTTVAIVATCYMALCAIGGHYALYGGPFLVGMLTVMAMAARRPRTAERTVAPAMPDPAPSAG